MNPLRLLIILFICLSLLCCRDESGKPSPGTLVDETTPSQKRLDTYEMISVGVKEFDLDDETRNWSLKMDIYKDTDGTRYLVNQNDNNNTLQFYHFETGVLDHQVRLSLSGPNTVKCLGGFYIKSIDSIFVFCGRTYQVFLVNRNGQVMDSHNLYSNEEQLKDKNSYGLSRMMPLTGNMVLVKGDTMFLPSIADGGFDQSSEDKYSIYLSQVWIDFNKKSYGYVYPYSEIYRKHNFAHLGTQIFRCMDRDGQFLVSFRADPYIYQTNFRYINNPHFAASRYFPEPEPMQIKGEHTTGDDLDFYINKSSSYRQILYDIERNIYYRVCMNGGDKTTDKYNAEKKELSVIIMNEDFQIVGETKLPADMYNFRNIFITDEGLYISNANKNNPHFDDDKLSFTIYVANEKMKG